MELEGSKTEGVTKIWRAMSILGFAAVADICITKFAQIFINCIL
jgi:hypothetical protein